MNMGNNILKRSAVAAAVSAGICSATIPQSALATSYVFSWTGYFTMLDSTGAALNNSSAAKGSNSFQTPVSGTLTYDDAAHTGTMTIGSFDFFSGTAPAVASGITLSDTDGAAAGTLLLGNMLFDWNGNNGIPVSIVWDAAGLLNYIGTSPGAGNVGDNIAGTGAIPASDGTYTNATWGYLNLGATPVATMEWNTTLAAGCAIGVDNDYTNNTGGGCMSVNPSGALPTVVDNAANTHEYAMGDGVGIGGNPMADGPFQNFSANFDLTSLNLVCIPGVTPCFTTPADISTTKVETPTPTTLDVDIGTVADEPNPGTDTVEYSIDGGAWQLDSGGVNTETFALTQTVNTFSIQWRVTDAGANVALAPTAQTVTITITDTTDPAFTSFPADITVNLNSTSEFVAFEGPTSTAGSVAATDLIEPNPTIEWSLNGTTWTQDTPAANETSNGFGPGVNTVYWRVTDGAGNTVTQNQTVTVNLPTGIVGVPCTVDPTVFASNIGDRQMEGTFIMRDPSGAVVGEIDTAVTGHVNTDPASDCDTEACTVSGAALVSPTPFYSELWTTNTIRLFYDTMSSQTYTFDTIQDGNPSLSMTVGPNQIGAHMLFDWSVNRDIDVVLVWEFGCGSAELVTTDPDGDGIVGTKMVDGPFKGFSASFDLSTKAGEQPLTSGGYSVTVPAVKNSVANSSPIALTPGTIGTVLGGVTITSTELFDTYGASTDDDMVDSCVGGCFDFSVSGVGAGSTIQVVLPLSEPIPYYSVYRKYDPSTNTWRQFVTSGTDNVKSAPLNGNGSCPEPGSGDYVTYSTTLIEGMLYPDHQCIQLTITDGGPNDTDPTAGVIGDPSGVALTSGPVELTTATSGGGCTMQAGGRMGAAQRADLWLMAGVIALFGMLRRKRSM